MKTLQATQSLFPTPADEAADRVRREIAEAFERYRRYLDSLHQWHGQNAASDSAKKTKATATPKPEVPSLLAR